MENEVSLYEYWLIIKKHRGLILKILAVTMIVTAFLAFRTPAKYKATTSFYFPLNEKSGGFSQLAGSVLGTDLAGDAEGLLSGRSPSMQNYTEGILQSNAIADDLIDRFNLMQYYRTKYRSAAENALKKSTSIDLTKDGIMEISVETNSPKLSADLANAYVDSFRDFSSSATFSIAKKQRIDVGSRLAKLGAKLKQAEADMVAFQAKHKTANFTDEANLLVKALVQLRVEELSTVMGLQTAKDTLTSAERISAAALGESAKNPLVSMNVPDPILANLRSQLADIYVKYAQAKATETSANPELQSYKKQLDDLESTMRAQLRRQITAARKGNSDFLLNSQVKVAELAAKVAAERKGIETLEKKFDAYPTIGLQFLRKERNLKVLDTLYAFLSTEYEKAALEEEKEEPNLQILDRAVPPDFKSDPHRRTDLIVGFLLGIFLGVGAAFFLESFKPPVQALVSGDGKSHSEDLGEVLLKE